MNLYFAAPSSPDLKPMLDSGNRYTLWSYHYYGKDSWYPKMQQAMEDYDIHTFVDSGAFSAFTCGIEIDIDKYCRWLLMMQPDMYATLDAIGDPIKTYDNTKYMENEYGLNPLPVFHMREDIKHLYKYLDYDYICLGGMVKSSGLLPWLDDVWQVIYKEKPDLKVHGFGLTGRIIKKYPFYSVDSSSWNSGTRFFNVSRYNPIRERIFDTELWKYAREIGLNYEKGQVLTPELRYFVINICCKAHIDFNKYVTEIHKDKDWTYLTQQLKLF